MQKAPTQWTSTFSAIRCSLFIFGELSNNRGSTHNNQNWLKLEWVSSAQDNKIERERWKIACNFVASSFPCWCVVHVLLFQYRISHLHASIRTRCWCAVFLWIFSLLLQLAHYHTLHIHTIRSSFFFNIIEWIIWRFFIRCQTNKFFFRSTSWVERRALLDWKGRKM